MKRFAYICADPGIPLPGTKGSSIHVESLCRALRDAGCTGSVHASRAESGSIAGLPLRPLTPGFVSERNGPCSPEERERALYLAGHRSVLALDERPDFVYERYSLWHTAGLARAREMGVPFVLEVNSPLPEEERRYRALANPALAQGIAGLLLAEADALVCVSREVAGWARAARGARDNVWVVPNGVDARLFDPAVTPRRPPRAPAGAPVVAFSGSFRPWHGVSHLLDAFEILVRQHGSNAHLLCIGDGPELAACERQLSDAGLSDRAHFTGRVAHADVPAWLASADVCVAPYPRIDGFYFSPIKIFEFLALGLPVVASAIGQIPELLPHGERGFLVPPGDAGALAAGIATVLRDRDAWRRVAHAGRAWVLDHATWRCRAEEILRHVSELP